MCVCVKAVVYAPLSIAVSHQRSEVLEEDQSLCELTPRVHSDFSQLTLPLSPIMIALLLRAVEQQRLHVSHSCSAVCEFVRFYGRSARDRDCP